ncbi:hypothetical protein SAMN02799642_02031 [Methylobacterium brachiatum]|nr:hypothetical protein SAMN02799642_02031 [Methylobacterium brachiatum]
MTPAIPRSIRGLLRGSRGDGVLTIAFMDSAVTVHAAPAWALDEMLEVPDLLGPGVYLLIGVAEEPSQKARAVVGEAGMLRERLAGHATDPKLDFVYEAIAMTGPNVMNETVRLILQRRLVDEIVHAGRIGRVLGRYPERCTASIYDVVAATRMLADVRPLFGLVAPGLIADVEPVTEPLAARIAALPRGVDPEGATWTTHEMAHAGANARASMLGRETVLLPRSTILAETRGAAKWIVARRTELKARGVLVAHADPRLLLVAAFIAFRTAHEAAAFVTGGAAGSARLTWLPVDEP